MATALAAQLAQIAARSSNPLDLKAQKKAHSKSLLFDQHVAASQDYDTLHQICYEGYLELCQLDNRFVVFSRSIFSEQSKREERSQMTTAQNKELDEVLESFLGLVGARLLLKPALKAVEWLVRRFRVHENNTQFLIFTFLPYHTMPMFATLLSILPKNLPPTFKFLHPYTQSFACPPRRAIVYTATNNQSFFTAFNDYVLEISRARQHYSAVLSYWASVATEALVGLIDQSMSGRREVQRQKEGDILLRILPILNEGLSMRHVPDLRVACYMIATVLASKIDLEDIVLIAMMEAIVLNWTPATTHAGLICLAVLAQQRQATKLPKKVFKSIILIESLETDLIMLNKKYRVDNLALGLIFGTLERLHKDRDTYKLTFVRTSIEAGLMSPPHIATAVKAIVAAAGYNTAPENSTLDRSQIADLVLTLVDSKEVGTIVQEAIRDLKIDIEQLGASLQAVLRPANDQQQLAIEDVEMVDAEQSPQMESLDVLAARIPTRTAYEISFLSHSESYVFGSLVNAFGVASSARSKLQTFSNFPVLRRSLAMTEPLFLSFFVRYWCGPYSASSKAAALGCVRYLFEETETTTDVQTLFPYVLYALADPAPTVRRAATELVTRLDSIYTAKEDNHQKQEKRPILGFENIYGQGSETKDLLWLTPEGASDFVQNILASSLEECCLDENYVSRLLTDALNGLSYGKNRQNSQRELKKSTRAALLNFLTSHTVSTPLYTVKLRLLSILNGVGRVGSTSRSKLLLPLLVAFEKLDEKTLTGHCEREQIDQVQFMHQAVRVVTPGDREGVQILQRMIALDDSSPPRSLRKAAFLRVQEIWNSLKHDMLQQLSMTLLDLAVQASTTGSGQDAYTEAMDVLRTVTLSSDILLSFLNELPTISATGANGPTNSKRRRTSHGHVEGQQGMVSAVVEESLRRVTTVLELIEASKSGANFRLMHGLFQLMGDLQQHKNQRGIELAYLQSLALACVRRIVEDSKNSGSGPIDQSTVRADVIIDCFRTTTSPQVEQAALLLMSSLSRIFPELIIHSIMPVFTFMGTGVLRQSDDYSAHVVEQTISSVIPPLVETLHKRKGGPLVGASELLLSFAAAFEHIPTHRRKALFTSLIDKLGAEEFLFALLVLLLDRYAEDREVLEFVKDFAIQYSPIVQLKTMDKYLGVALDSLKPKPTISSHLLSYENGRTRASTVLNLLSLPPQIFHGERLLSKTEKLLSIDGEDATGLRQIYARLVEQTILLADQIQPYKKLPKACDEMLDALLSLFTLQESTASLGTLLKQGNNNVRRQVLKSLEHRISTDKPGNLPAQQACISFLSELTHILKESSDPLLVLAATSCIDRIIDKYGKTNVDRLIEVVKIVAGEKCLGANEPRLRTMGLLCLATSAEVLGEAIITIIPEALPEATNHLKLSLDGRRVDEGLHNAAYSFIGALLLYIPWMITGQYLDRILTVSYESATSDLPVKCNESRVDVLDLVSKQIKPNYCFAALDRTWESAMVEGPEATEEYLRILSVSIERQPKSNIAKYSQKLLAIFLQVFDLRRLQCFPRTKDSYEDNEIDGIEQSANDVAIKMVYKLNDSKFRPIFIKILEWATISTNSEERQGKVYRQITWYKFLHTFFETLQSIVTGYAGFIIEDAARILNELATDLLDVETLWNRVISTLHSSFEHDQDKFWQSPAHFSTISSPLLAQLTKAPHLPVLPSLIPCITALAVAADSPDHHKSLNAALLAHMRSDSATVRLAAVQCEMSLTTKLGEEWLSLLPEMLPFISELQEDDDEKVEREVTRWIVQIEGILGESLDSMLL